MNVAKARMKDMLDQLNKKFLPVQIIDSLAHSFLRLSKE